MIDYKYADLFLNSATRYNLIIDCDGKRLDNGNLKGAWTLTESLTENKLQIGQCVPDRLVLQMVNDGTSYLDKDMDVFLVLDNHDDEPFEIGHFKCYTEVLENDRRSRKITVFDAMYGIIHADAKPFLDSLTYPITQKDFRDAFFAWCSIDQEDAELPNDDFLIKKKPEENEFSGKKVIESICQANGCFGHVGRDGIFHYIFLIQSLVPSEDLYPSDDLLPGMDLEADVVARTYKSLKYEDYEVREITGVHILVEEKAEGTSFGDPENVLTLSDNFLFYNQSKADLDAMAANILEAVSDIVFTPIDLEMKCNFCLEVGDRIEAQHRNGTKVSAYVLNRTIKGVQSFMDHINSAADEKQEVKATSLQQKISNVQAQSNANERNIKETKIQVGDLEADNANIHGTLNAQSAEIDDIKTKKLDADQLSAEVAKLGYATIGQLDAQKGRIDDLQSKAITTENLGAQIAGLSSLRTTGLEITNSRFKMEFNGNSVFVGFKSVGGETVLAIL